MLLQNELNSDIARYTTYIKPVLQQIRLLTGLSMGGKNTQHRYSTRFAAMLQNKLHAFCCLFFRTLRVSSSKFFLEIPISQTERSQELRLWSQRMKSMFCQLLPTTFIGATIGNFSFDARVWRVKFGAHDFAFHSRECKILSLKDCRHQNVDYFPSVINSYSFVFFLFFFFHYQVVS